MGDIWTTEGPDIFVQTLFEKHKVFTVTMHDIGDGINYLYAEDLAEHLNETGYHLLCSFGGDVYAVPKNYEQLRAEAWADPPQFNQ